METTPVQISSLPQVATPLPQDLAVIMEGGVASIATLASLILAFSVATGTSKGLMSAGDKAQFDSIVAAFPTINDPQIVTLPAAATITLPLKSGPYTVLTISGTIEITTISNLIANRLYFISYPTGAGVTILGTPYVAGDVKPFIAI